MYATCLFCHGSLGRNELVEHFPVGRKLAFDEERGRLWVVCPACARWNLTPLEERWEAIEECERLFRETPRRASSENVGLARLPGGLSLVRIGRPKRPEFAAWRYGELIRRRRQRTFVAVGAGIGALGVVVSGGLAAGVIGFGMFGIVHGIAKRIVHGSPEKLVAHIPTPTGGALRVDRRHLADLRLLHDDGVGWALEVAHAGGRARLAGDPALRAAGQLLPGLSRFAGADDDIERAVRILEEEPDPMRAYARLVVPSGARGRGREPRRTIANLPDPMRLALEMAAHEEQERRALEGELAPLESAWREAEEIAKIADDMFLPAWIGERLDRLRGGG